MASKASSHRAVTVGISGSLGVLLPAAAYAATVPFDAVHQLVAAYAGPFAVGAVAGVGILALSSALADRRAARSRREDGTESAQDAEQAAAGAKPAQVKGVPVIARAADALSEEEAWADIEALLAEDSPISCDPERSMDLYEIALAELRRGQEPPEEVAPEGDAAEEPASDDAQPQDEDAASNEAPADVTVVVAREAAEPLSTDVYLALAAGRPAAGSVAADEDAPSSVSDERSQDEDARAAAVASLFDSHPAPSASAEEEGHGARPATPEERAARWARALAIMEEDVDPFVVEEPRPAGAHFSAPERRSRIAAVAEGEQSTALHAHVNGLLSEELAEARSQSVRRTGREYLRVIQGGTASLPRLQAEA